MRSLQSDINDLLRKGKRPSITLFPATEIRVPKRAAGRPRKYAEGMPIVERYAGRRGKWKPRCLARGCKKVLRIDQVGTCSPACADAVFNQAMMLLRTLRVSPQELIEVYGARLRHVQPQGPQAVARSRSSA